MSEAETTTACPANKFDADAALIAIIPKADEGERTAQAISFIDTYLVRAAVKAEAEIFIENKMLKYLNISPRSTNGKIIQKHFRSAYKAKHEVTTRKARRPVTGETLAISPEFTGLYDVDENENTGKIKIVPFPDRIAYRVIDTLHVISYKENLYCYNEGVYVNSPALIEAEATRILNGICKNNFGNGIKSKLADVMVNIRNNNPVTEYPFNQTKNVLNVKNGVIVFDDTGAFRLEDHDPEKHIFNYILPVEYDENANSRFIIETIEKYTEKDEAVYQILTQTFLQAIGKKSFKTAYLIYGPPDYGKTTIADIYRAILGKNYSALALGRMSGDANNKFSLAPLEGKLMNIKDELSYFKIEDSNTFKDIVGSYNIWVEPKHVDAYAATSTAVHVFLTNRSPNFDGRVKDDDGFWKRWVLIPCTKTKFPRDESYVEDVILTKENLSALLNEVLYRMIDYLAGNPLPYRSNVGDEWENVRDEWMQAGNPLYKFIVENMERGRETAIPKDELLIHLKAWCENGNILHKKDIPQREKDLIETITICGGSIHEKKTFFLYPAVMKNGKKQDRQERPCFILPWHFKNSSAYKNAFSQVTTLRYGE